MNKQAADNQADLRTRLHDAGMLEPLAILAGRIFDGEPRRPSPWSYNYCRAYSDGHNNHALHGRLLDHYANAFADICEEVDALTPDLEMTLEAFWLQWTDGAVFEATATEHWYRV